MFNLLIPLLAVVAVMIAGAASSRLLPGWLERFLNQYVYYLAFPAILYVSLAKTPIEQILNPGFVLGYLLAMVVTYVLVQLWSLKHEQGQPRPASLRALSATFGNTAFIGIPVLAMLFPDNPQALMAAALASLLSVLMFAVTVVQLRLASQPLTGIARLSLALRVVSRNPVVIGCALGVLASAMQFSLPPILEPLVTWIGKSSSPCALFAIGIALARSMREPEHSRVGVPFWHVNLAKLALQPLLVWLLFSWFGVDTQLTVMGVLLSAMPTAASVYLLAYQDKTLEKQIARGIVAGTLLTLFSLPLLTMGLNLITQ
ncbi:AEC family transporter [Shewanella amazonensis]|uniref:Transporter, putative n=1 Tax=Shewanella amazonensis (strain ATCC BAA-1098 / SB2B) TaxID=326297 RepID=A1S4C8_SHEAM|nr:AEC family transporter [Shewanella amazonensis]ABL99234.1 transporter, putative [Shewanella amazonensis SB2B]